jgi:hypothetical protein
MCSTTSIGKVSRDRFPDSGIVDTKASLSQLFASKILNKNTPKKLTNYCNKKVIFDLDLVPSAVTTWLHASSSLTDWLHGRVHGCKNKRTILQHAHRRKSNKIYLRGPILTTKTNRWAPEIVYKIADIFNYDKTTLLSDRDQTLCCLIT